MDDAVRLGCAGSPVPFRLGPAFTKDVAAETDRVIGLGARALKVHPPHQRFRANAYQQELPELARLYEELQKEAPVPAPEPRGNVALALSASGRPTQPYEAWMLSTFGAEMLDRFGGGYLVEKGLLPMGLMGMLTKSRFSWDG